MAFRPSAPRWARAPPSWRARSSATQAAGDASTVFGYSQSSTLSGIAMQLLDPSGSRKQDYPLTPQFLLIADPSNPNGGLLERFNGFETTSGQTTVDPLNLAEPGYFVRRRDPGRRLHDRHLLAGIRRLRRLPALPAELPVRPQRLFGYRRAPRHLSERRRGRRRPHSLQTSLTRFCLHDGPGTPPIDQLLHD